jgi:ubiquinone/menaquinone biosynthesis C-methylase UbiE
MVNEIIKRIMKIEEIPGFASKGYSFIARKFPFFKEFYGKVAKEVTEKISSGKMLDIGTGPGYLPLEIAKCTTDLKIIGIDLSPGMIKIANKNAKDRRLSYRVSFQVANAANLPFENEYFDLVISTLSFHHWLKPIECIKEIFRVLKENGEAWIYEIRKDTSKEVNAQLREKYGWFLSFWFLNIVRAHSSMSKSEIEKLLSSPEVPFSKKTIEDEGIILKLKLLKYGDYNE